MGTGSWKSGSEKSCKGGFDSICKLDSVYCIFWLMFLLQTKPWFESIFIHVLNVFCFSFATLFSLLLHICLMFVSQFYFMKPLKKKPNSEPKIEKAELLATYSRSWKLLNEAWLIDEPPLHVRPLKVYKEITNKPVHNPSISSSLNILSLDLLWLVGA